MAQTIITQQPVAPGTVIVREPAAIPAPIELTPAQRTVVYRTIVREQPVVAAPAGVEVRVGSRVPANAQLYTLPESVAVEVPTVKAYRYMVVNNRVVLVDPETSMVVSEIVE
jgi:hypothetical protein